MKKISVLFFSAVILFTLAAFIQNRSENVPTETGFVDYVPE